MARAIPDTCQKNIKACATCPKVKHIKGKCDPKKDKKKCKRESAAEVNDDENYALAKRTNNNIVGSASGTSWLAGDSFKYANLTGCSVFAVWDQRCLTGAG